MSLDKRSHLTDDQILQAVVDEEELSLPIREHLSTCFQCRDAKKRFEEELSKVGHMARRSVPIASQRISLPDEEPRRHKSWFWGWRGWAGAALAAGLVILSVWWSPVFRPVPEDSRDMLAEETWEGEAFMAEISVLVENALPPEYLVISGESDPGFDEVFMQFVVPSIETEPLSHDTGREVMNHVKA